MNVQQHIMPQLQDLYQHLEREFAPLRLCIEVNTILEFLQKNEELELSQYIKPVQEMSIVRLLKQVSQCFRFSIFCRGSLVRSSKLLKLYVHITF